MMVNKDGVPTDADEADLALMQDLMAKANLTIVNEKASLLQSMQEWASHFNLKIVTGRHLDFDSSTKTWEFLADSPEKDMLSTKNLMIVDDEETVRKYLTSLRPNVVVFETVVFVVVRFCSSRLASKSPVAWCISKLLEFDRHDFERMFLDEYYKHIPMVVSQRTVLSEAELANLDQFLSTTLATRLATNDIQAIRERAIYYRRAQRYETFLDEIKQRVEESVFLRQDSKCASIGIEKIELSSDTRADALQKMDKTVRIIRHEQPTPTKTVPDG